MINNNVKNSHFLLNNEVCNKPAFDEIWMIFKKLYFKKKLNINFIKCFIDYVIVEKRNAIKMCM